MPTGESAYMPEGEMEGCDGCEGCDSMSQTVPDPPQEQTMAERGAKQEERLETTNIVLGLIAGRLANVAEAVQINVREAEIRHDDWKETIKDGCEVLARNQKTSAIIGFVLVVVISTLTSVIVGLLM